MSLDEEEGKRKKWEIPPENLQAKQGASRWGDQLQLDQGQQVYSRACTIPPIGAQEHPVLSRNAPKKGSALHAQ